MPTTVSLPFSTDDVSEVPLKAAPLASVLAQIRFPREETLALRSSADMIRKLLEKYPIIDEERAQVITIGPSGPVMSTGGDVLFRLAEKSRKWRVTIAADFVALETTQYTSRHDFCRRLAAVADAVTKVAEPAVFTRVGVRYTNRLKDEALDRLDELVRPELAGVGSMPAHGGGSVTQVVTDMLFQFPEEDSQVHARWGLLPPGVSLDPGIEPVPVRSWVLDIDSAIGAPEDFESKAVEIAADRCARRAYVFFRWAVTDDFLASHGGPT